MKKLLLLVITFMGCLDLTGQTLDNPGTPEERAQKITLEMSQALPLDSTEVEPIYALNLKYAQKAQLEVLDPSLSMWSRYRKGLKLNAQKEHELKELLTEPQWENYLKQKAVTKKEIFRKLFSGL